MSDAPSRQVTPVLDETQRRGQLVLRVLPVLLIPIITGAVGFMLTRLTLQYQNPALVYRGEHHPFSPVILIIVLAVFLTALIVLARLGRPTVSALMLIVVWTLITTLASSRSGVESNWPALLIIPICVAGLLIDGVACMSLAGLATLMVGSLALLEGGSYPASQQGIPMVALTSPLAAAGFWASIFWTVAALTSLLAGGLQRTLDHSREQAEALRELSAQLEGRVAAQTAELAQRTTRAEALYEISQALTSTLDLNQVLSLIVEQAARLLGFDSALVVFREPDGSLAPLGAYGHPDSIEGQQEAIASVLDELREHHQPLLVPVRQNGKDARMALIIPMHYASSFAGLLVLTNADGSGQCDEDGLVLGQGLADQAAIAIANAQLLAQAREAAMLEERTRLARDIHDTLAQGLTGIVVQLGAAQRALNTAPAEALEHLTLAQRMARESLAEARRSVWNLRAPALERGDLSDALRGLVARPLGQDIAATFELCGEPWELPSAVESTLLRVCQEALVNVVKHASATMATVILAYEPDSVRLSICDNGVGFDPETLGQVADGPGPWMGFGLLGMKERVTALGGRLDLRSDSGAQVVAVIPRPNLSQLDARLQLTGAPTQNGRN